MYALTELQLAIMNVLWIRGEAGIAVIHEDVRRDRSTRESTVASLLSRLESRGLVASRKEGRTNIYRPLIERGEASEDVVGEFVERVSALFPGGTPSIVRALMLASDTDRDELRAIREMIEDRERELEVGQR